MDDATTFPIYVTRTGTMYGFCPAKATWDSELHALMRLLVITAESGVMIEHGGLNDQPEWWIEILAWFLPLYDNVKFYSRAMSVIGEGGKKLPGRAGG